MKNFDSKDSLFIIDGSSFLYRAYYSIRPLNTSKGTPVNAVYGFCRMIKKLLDNFDPKYLVLVWDSKGPTVRHGIYTEYKATRQAAPNDLFIQKDIIQKFADTINLKQVAEPGVEADDLMYSLAIDAVKNEQSAILITSDKDLGQVVKENIVIFDPFKDIILDKEALEKKLGFNLDKLVFYYALLGDSSDNIPGVRGIGPKAAGDLLQQFSSMQDLYNNLDKISSNSVKQKLEAGRDDAFLSEKLFKLHYYQVYKNKEEYYFKKENWNLALDFFNELEFTSLVKTINLSGSIFDKINNNIEEFKYPEDIDFVTVQTEEQLQKLCKDIEDAGLCAIDTETDGLKPLENNLIGICLAFKENSTYYVPFGHKTEELQLSKEKVVEILKPVLENKLIKKFLHHAQFDVLTLYKAGIKLENIVFDTMIAASLLTTELNNKVGLKYLSQYYLKMPMQSFQSLTKKLGVKSFDKVDLKHASKYGAYDAHQTLLLTKILMPKLEQNGFANLYNLIEHPVIEVLIEMQKTGVLVDQQILEQLDLCVMNELDKIRALIASIVGPELIDINLNSPKQLEDLLFNKLGLKPIKKTTQKTGYSTDYEVLVQLAKSHDIPVFIIRYRELAKLKSTYIEGLRNFINSKTNKVHTQFSQIAVATGRLASSDPNLQNVPLDNMDLPIHIRSAFIAPKNELLISVDYSQIELRVLAYLSQDKALIQAFNNNADIHAKTAANIFEINPEQVTTEQRQVGKRINFSILYGLTPYGLAKDLDISYKMAELYINRYFSQYSGVRAWMDHVILETKELGYVQTLWGRRRYIPGIHEKNKSLYEAAQRVAINTIAQGTAAELMKLGMINTQKMLFQDKLEAKLLLQIHDELIFSAAQDKAEKIAFLIKNKLENIVDWNIPLITNVRIGQNWEKISK